MQGSVEIDAVIGIVIFLSFLTWAFMFYTTITEEESYPLTGISDGINNKILDFLSVDVTSMSIKCTVSNTTDNAVLYLYHVWPEGTKNSTKVLSGSDILPCQFIGNALYWQGDVTNESDNYFTMRYSSHESGLQCDSSFTIENETQTLPFSGEERTMISQAKINQMVNTSYWDFKNDLGIDRDFQVEMNISGSVTTYGQSPPVASDVVSVESDNIIEETNELISIQVLVF